MEAHPDETLLEEYVRILEETFTHQVSNARSLIEDVVKEKLSTGERMIISGIARNCIVDLKKSVYWGNAPELLEEVAIQFIVQYYPNFLDYKKIKKLRHTYQSN